MTNEIEKLEQFIRSFGLYAGLIAMFATLLQASFPYVPFIVIAAVNVLVFGLVNGMIVTYIMTVLGAMAAFLFARNAGRNWVTRKLAKYNFADKLNDHVSENGFFYVLMARFAFVIPSVAVNWISGVSRMRFSRFTAATVIGKLPVVVLETMLGHDLLHYGQNKTRLYVLVVLFIGFALTGKLIRDKILGKSTV